MALRLKSIIGALGKTLPGKTHARATTLCFSTGNQVIAGTKSTSLALLAHLTFILMISRSVFWGYAFFQISINI